jgi:H/ACA ribonucleoprotein complex subunit 4
VTGVLVVLTGSATNVMSYMHNFKKEYVGVGELHAAVSESRLKRAVRELVGRVYQRPPVRSAVSRKLRTREVYYFDILEMRDRRFLFRAGTESGTYARKLINDVGLLLGTGAHMAELRRTIDGPFSEESAHSMWDVAASLELYGRSGDDSLLRRVFLPVEMAISAYASVYVKDSAVASICHGANLAVGGISSFEDPIAVGEDVALKTLKGELIAMGKATKDSSAMARDKAGIAVKTVRVVMDRGLYPKMWR